MYNLRTLAGCVIAVFVCSSVATVSTGCSRSSSVTDGQKMRDAFTGKGVGPMPPEVRAKMEAAMKRNSVTVPGETSTSGKATK